MTDRTIRMLLWSGCLGGVILFVGDMLYYGAWGSGRSFHFFSSLTASAPWRLHLGSITGPVGVAFDLLGMLGLWFCCRRSAPRLAITMLACMYANDLSTLLQHGIVGPLAFAARDCGRNSDAVAQILKLGDILSTDQMVLSLAGLLIWVFLVLRKKANVPRWTVLACPLVTYWLEYVVVYVPLRLASHSGADGAT